MALTHGCEGFYKHSSILPEDKHSESELMQSKNY